MSRKDSYVPNQGLETPDLPLKYYRESHKKYENKAYQVIGDFFFSANLSWVFGSKKKLYVKNYR